MGPENPAGRTYELPSGQLSMRPAGPLLFSQLFTCFWVAIKLDSYYSFF